MDQTKSLIEMKETLNKVGPGFCLAKWTQVTIHLQTGHTHSCHHPKTHKIPLEELASNPSALHNTTFKKQLRQEMLEGGRPEECNYCWKIEDLPGSHFSDRHIKSADEWSKPYLNEIMEAGSTGNISPKYLEISFSNKCNFKCAYCSPSVSSKWFSEIKTHGPYPTHALFNNLELIKEEDKMPMEDEDQNPYVSAFWKWWPSIYKELKVFRVTGGEPLLAKSTYKFLDYIKENPNPNLQLGINSNLGVPEETMVKFVRSLKEATDKKAIGKVIIFTSLDTWGAQAEYIRDGLDLDLFQKNLNYLMENVENTTLSFMCTFNLLSVPRFHEFIEYISVLKKRESERRKGNNVFVDISYLRYPQFLSVKLLDAKYAAETLQKSLDAMETLATDRHGYEYGFHRFEIIKMARLIEFINAEYSDNERYYNRMDFYAFASEFDRRRNYKFEETFPELKDFYKNCKEKLDEWQSQNPHTKWAGDYYNHHTRP